MQRRGFLGAILGLFGLGAAKAAEPTKECFGYSEDAPLMYVRDDFVTEAIRGGKIGGNPKERLSEVLPEAWPGWRRVRHSVSSQADGCHWEAIDEQVVLSEG